LFHLGGEKAADKLRKGYAYCFAQPGETICIESKIGYIIICATVNGHIDRNQQNIAENRRAKMNK